MSMAKLLATAIRIAAEVHEHQKDRGGNPYILHPLAVMQGVSSTDFELMAIAILHDVVEDSQFTFAMLFDNGITMRVINALKLLTHESKIDKNSSEEEKDADYAEYIQRIIDSGNKDAMAVKLSDLTHNSALHRMKGITQKDFRRMQRYSIAYNKIKNAIGYN